MTGDPDTLLNGYLDGSLTPVEQAELNAWVAADPANARRFAELARLHDRLGTLLRPVRAAEPRRPRARRWSSAVVVAAGVLIAVLALAWLTPGTATAANELDRLIDRAAPGDRTYRIRTLDEQPEAVNDRRPPIDGAILHVRAPDQYVLTRKFPDGRPFVTGSDGERSWSIPPEPNRPVRVSHDPTRFRGPLPGNQHGIPFADLRSDLAEVREAYTLAKLPAEAGFAGLRAVKKSREYRGANEIELRYAPATSVIHRMTFHGLPRNRGGPEGVAVELIEQRDLGPNFFRHEAHHEPTRKVVEEE